MSVTIRAITFFLIILFIPIDALAVELEVIAARKDGNWEAVLYRNTNSDRLFCAMESSDSNSTVIRIVRYSDTFDTFLEIVNTKWNLMQGNGGFSLLINIGHDNYRVKLNGERFSNAYSYDFIDKDKYLILLGMISEANYILVENPNGEIIAKFDGSGSAAALRNYADCLTRDWKNSEGSQSCISPLIKEDMKYLDARKIIMSHGYMTQDIPAYGYKSTDEKVMSECQSVDICNRYPEIDSCGTGHCKMSFRDINGNKLYIFTYGELDNGAYVTGFELSCK